MLVNKKTIFSQGVLCFFGLLSLSHPAIAEDKSSTREGLISLPSAGGTVRKEGGSFQVQSNTGSVAFSLPLPPIQGRAGQTAALNLQYSQFAGDNGSGFGVGWSLSVPSIEFDAEVGTLVTARKGEGGDGDFYSRVTYKGDRLVFLRRENQALIYAPERGTNYVRVQYFDNPFVVKVRGKSGGLDDISFEQGFIVTQADGSREVFSGNPSDAERTENFVVRWPLAAQITPTDEAIRYEYRQEGGRSYVKAVSFAGGRSRYDFEFMPARSSIVSFRNVVEQRNALLVNAIRASFDNRTTAQWCLAYIGRDLLDPSKQSIRTAARCQEFATRDLTPVVDNQSLSVLDSLRAVYRFGVSPVFNGSIARDPSVYLDYSSWTQGDLGNRKLAYAPPNLTWLEGISPSNFEIADFNHDSLVDIVRSDRSDANPFLVSQGTGNLLKAFSDPIKWFIYEIRQVVSGDVFNPRGASLSQNTFHFADLNGDSFSDIIGVEFGKLKLYKINNERYEQDRKEISLAGISPDMFQGGHTQFVDVNQDGFTDLITTQPNSDSTGSVVKIWMNISANSDGTAKDISFDVPFELPLYDKELSFNNTNVRLMDITGDKLPDLVRFKPTGFCLSENHGNLYDVNAQVSGVSLFGDPKINSAECGKGAKFVKLNGLRDWQNAKDLWFVDVNGDGIVDSAKIGESPSTLLVWLGLGGGSFIPEPMKLDIGVKVFIGDDSKFKSRVADIDGDGQQEIVIMQFEPGQPPVIIIDLNRINESKQLVKANLLTSIRMENGLRHDVRYTTSIDEILRDKSKGLKTNSLHFPVAMVKQVTTTEGKLTGVEEFLYHNPVYAAVTRKFLGFEQVEKIAYGDNYQGGNKTQNAAYTNEVYYISPDKPEMRGEVKLRSVHSFEPQSTFAEEQRNSANLDFSHAEIHSIGDYARSQALPVPGKLLSESERFVQLVPAYGVDYIKYIREISVKSREGDGVNYAYATTENYDFDMFNLPARTRQVSYPVNGLKNIVVPGRGIDTITDYVAARAQLAGLGIVASPSNQKTFALEVNSIADASSFRAAQPISNKTFNYISTNGLVEKTSNQVYSATGEVKFNVDQAFVYDEYGNKIQESDGLGVMERVGYDEFGTLAIFSENSLGHRTSLFYAEVAPGAPVPNGFDPSSSTPGLPTQMLTPRGEWTFITYDELGRKIKSEASGGREEHYAYRMPLNGKPSLIFTSVRRFADNDVVPKGETRTVANLQAYNSKGTELAKLEAAEIKGSRVLSYSEYNRNALKIKEWTPYIIDIELEDIFNNLGEIPFNGDHYNSMRYDELGRPISTVYNKTRTDTTAYFPWGTSITVNYDDPNSGSRKNATKYSFSRSKVIYAFMDELGFIYSYDRDLRDQLSSIILPNTEPRTLQYDSLGNLEMQVIPGIGKYVYTHNPRGSVIREERFSATGEKTADIVSALDAVERVVKITTNDRISMENVYDTYKENTEIPSSSNAIPVGVVTHTTIYDPNKINNVEHTIFYNVSGTPSEHLRKIGEKVFKETYSYTLDGVIRSMVDSLGVVSQVSLGRSMRLVSSALKLPWATNFEPVIENVTYNPKGQIRHIDFRAGANTDIEYDEDSLLPIRTKSDAQNGALPLQDLKLTYDGRLNVVKIDDQITTSPIGLVNRSGSFDYNERNELISAKRYGKTLEYGYDGNGAFTRNLELGDTTFFAGSGASTLIPASPSSDRYEFDSSGRLIKNAKMLDARYDTFGKLIYAKTSAAEIWLGYDGVGKRVYRRVIANGVTRDSYYPTQNVIIENGDAQSFVFVGKERTARIEHNQKRWFYYLKDNVGSTEILMSADGIPVEQIIYQPYGTELNPIDLAPDWKAHLGVNSNRTPTQITKHRYTGHYLDTDLGFYDFGMRNYDPKLGRFLQPDPSFVGNPEKCVTSPLECNLYGYANNNPLSFIDPTGLDASLSVDYKNKTVTVGATIYIHGSGATDQSASGIQKNISDAWNGAGRTVVNPSTGETFKVKFEVKVINENNRNFFQAIGDFFNKLFSSDTNRVEVSGSNRSFVSGGMNTGVWRDSSSWAAKGNPASHEFGHLLGIDDHYTDSKGTDPAWKGNIMGEGAGKGVVDQRNIDTVAKPAFSGETKINSSTTGGFRPEKKVTK